MKFVLKHHRGASWRTIVAGAVILGASYIYELQPSPYAGTPRYIFMEKELAALLTQTGKVLDVYNSSKAGRLHMHRIVSDEGWSLQRLQDTLTARGWQHVPGQRILYCKDGIQVELFPNAGMRDKVGTNNIRMDLNQDTVAECRYALK